MIEWFDDLKVGMKFKSDEITVSKEDILRFASEFDPQPFHLDEEAAKNTVFKGLAASGWHTAAIAMRLATSCRPCGPHPLLGAGGDDLRWPKPVRPGDTLHLEGEVVELVPSKTKPQGIARIKWTAYNQHGEAVYTFNPIGIVPRRPAWSAGGNVSGPRAGEREAAHRADAHFAGYAVARDLAGERQRQRHRVGDRDFPGDVVAAVGGAVENLGRIAVGALRPRQHAASILQGQRRVALAHRRAHGDVPVSVHGHLSVSSGDVSQNRN